MTVTCYLAQNLPDLHEGDMDDYGVEGASFKTWMANEIILAILITLILCYFIDDARGNTWKPIAYLWLGVAMFVGLFQIILIYSGFTPNIHPPVVIFCGVVLWLTSTRGKSLKSGEDHPLNKSNLSQSAGEKNGNFEFRFKDGIIRFHCPHCNRKLRAQCEDAHTQQPCPKCKKVLMVPNPKEV